MSHRVRQPTRVLPAPQTSHGKETVDGDLSQSHPAILGPQAGYPAPDKAQRERQTSSCTLIHFTF